MLRVDSVQLAYGGRKILQDVYLDCKPGEIVGLLGRNGCGKSSLLRVIFGTTRAGHQFVSINDKHIAKGYVNHHIAYLPQHHYLPANIPIKQLAQMLVDTAEWNEFSAYPVYKNQQHKKPGQLSGGELRQLETLMILYSKAPYLLLDEPFTHISPIQAEELKVILRKRAETRGIIITDHQYQNILDVSDRIILITNGCTKVIRDDAELITYGYLSNTK